jgi:hypothetical protein
MSPFRLAAVALFAVPLVAPAQDDDPPAPLSRSVAKLPEGAVMRVGESPHVLSMPSNTLVLSPEGKRIAGDASLMVTREAKMILARWR